MSYLVLPRKYRPLGFSDMVGQEAVTDTLKNAIRRDRVAHAYLFSGSRGTGKTSMARILAKALNCPEAKNGEPCNKCEMCKSITSGMDVDVVEIDGASNNKVEEARDLRENVRYVPQRAKYKIYIIDEVHMLTMQAFNALLKTLEEPPPHVKFILATTEPHKLPDTIHSRCQRFDFHRISPKAIVARLAEIAKKEKIKTAEGVFEAIAGSTRGGLRDAISLLDQLSNTSADEVTVQDLNNLLGRAGSAQVSKLFEAISTADTGEVLELVAGVIEGGRDIVVFVDEVISFTRNTLVVHTCTAETHLLEAVRGEVELFKSAAKKFSPDTLLYILEMLSSLKSRIRWASDKRTPVEVAFVKLARMGDLESIGELLGRLERLESGAPASTAGRPAQKKSEGLELDRKLEIDEISSWWPEFTAALMKESREIGAFVKGTTPSCVIEGRLKVIAPSELQKERLSAAASRRELESLLEKATGRTLIVEVELAQSAKKAAPAVDNPKIKKLKDDFNARIVEN